VKSPLEDVRVVETGSLEAGAYCAKLLADFGADVVKVEPPEGDPLRRAPPFVGPKVDPDSALFAWLNAGKRSLVAGPNDSAKLAELLAGADVLVDSTDAHSARRRHADYLARFPDLTIVSLSWFGETGPYRDFTGSDAVCRALAGLVKLAGPIEGPPVFLPDHQASVFAGLSAFTATAAALWSAQKGRRFEVSVLESSVVLSEFPAALASYDGVPELRLGLNKFHPTFMGIYPCREGWLGVTAGGPRLWWSFCELLGFTDWLEDSSLDTRAGRFSRLPEIDARIGARLKDRTAREWFEMTKARRLPIVMVPTMADLLAEPVHRAAGAFETIEIGASRFEAPTTPLRLTATPPGARGPAPALGSSDVAWPGAAQQASLTPPPPAAAAASKARPLQGVRILDLAMGWAGPLVSRQLADLGAEVLKIEACAYPDWFRPPLIPEDRARPHELNPWYAALNRGKFGAAIDVYAPDGVAVIKQLLKTVDALVENYSAEVMPKVGLGYDAVRRINPSIVMLSMPAFSAQGDWRSVRAYGSTLEHGSGLPSVAGPADGPPAMSHVAYGDPNGGLNGAAALMAALLHQRRTGEGQHIDLSQVQAMFPLAAPWLIEQSITGEVRRNGSRHPLFVPNGAFRCAGDDEWIVVSLTNDDAWPALCGALGRDDLAKDPALRTAVGRRGREAEIEAALAGWAGGRGPDQAMAELQAVGVAAGVARAPGQLFDDPHLRVRGDWQLIDRAWSGLQPIFSAPFREDGVPYPIERPAPTLGEHNRRILCEQLGLSEADLERLIASGVSGDDMPRPKG
jgi:crotonobetainyl-CoA:carnitine CoA-transferase CaiB-like acyl-CoA transferase